MTSDESRELRIWITEQLSERLSRLEQQSAERADQMRGHTAMIEKLERTDRAILKRLDRIDGYFETLMNIRTFIVWATPIITFILAIFALLWGGQVL